MTFIGHPNKGSKKNYQRETEKILEGLKEQYPDRVPTLLLHSCCAPCSSYCLEYLSNYFEITIFYYNPNIYPPEEYGRRVAEQRHLAGELPSRYPIHVVEGEYEPKKFYEAVRGLEHIREGGARCFACFNLRISQAAQMARKLGFDYYTTTLTISPLKNAGKINEIGIRYGAEYSVEWLPSDFKKKEGYKRSVELTREYNLYRQDYCGCVFSKKEKMEQGEESPGARFYEWENPNR